MLRISGGYFGADIDGVGGGGGSDNVHRSWGNQKDKIESDVVVD